MKPQGWKGHPCPGLRLDKAEACGCSLLGGRASTPCTRALANQTMLFPLVWYVFNWSEAHDSKELTKFVASLVNFCWRVAFSAFICHLTPILLLTTLFAVIGKCHWGIWKHVESASSSCIYWVFLLIMEKIVTWQIPSVIYSVVSCIAISPFSDLVMPREQAGFILWEQRMSSSMWVQLKPLSWLSEKFSRFYLIMQ